MRSWMAGEHQQAKKSIIDKHSKQHTVGKEKLAVMVSLYRFFAQLCRSKCHIQLRLCEHNTRIIGTILKA